MGIMIHGGTGAENHCIVIESSQTYPADLPTGGHSGMRAKRADPEIQRRSGRGARCAIADLRYARRLSAGGAEPRPPAHPHTRQLARRGMTAEITPRRD